VFGRRTWSELGFIAVVTLLALPGLAYALLATLPAMALSVAVIGLPILAGGVSGARGWGGLHRGLVRRLLGVSIAAPPAVVRRGVRPGLADATGWRALLYLVLQVPLALVDLYLVLAAWVVGAFYALYVLWWWMLLPTSSAEPGRPGPGTVATVNGYSFDTWPEVVLLAAAGVGVVLAAPRLTRAMVWVHLWLARVLLGPTRASELRDSRAAAVDFTDARLRRIERDLHDGPQAQLVAMAMKLGMAKEELRDGQIPAAVELIDIAHSDAKQAISELRDLVRGIRPPALDAGLQTALLTLASRSAIQVEVRLQLTEQPSPAIAAIAYFSVAELLANAAKHSRCPHATVSLAAGRPGWLRLAVCDGGGGGAALDPWPQRRAGRARRTRPHRGRQPAHHQPARRADRRDGRAAVALLMGSSWCVSSLPKTRHCCVKAWCTCCSARATR
jgi:signal transduction histidine kinase